MVVSTFFFWSPPRPSYLVLCTSLCCLSTSVNSCFMFHDIILANEVLFAFLFILCWLVVWFLICRIEHKSWMIFCEFVFKFSADSPPPSFSSQSRSNGAAVSHMGPHGGQVPPPPPGTGSPGTAAVQPRLGTQTGGPGSGGGSGSGQEPSPMDMSIGPQPSQPMTASHGMPASVYLVL